MRTRTTWFGVALLTLAAAATAHADRPKVCILGVEVVGDGIDVESIKVGNNLTNALRVRPNATPTPYQITPNCNKELADEKVIKNCGSEDPSCMSAIGTDLGADVLIYGKLEKSTQNNAKGYSAHLVILTVGKKATDRSWKDFIPSSETGPDDIQKWAKAAYSKLTGNSQGGLVIKVENPEVDKGTVFIDGKVGDKLSGGKATLSGISEGKHHLVVEVGGFKRYEEDITVQSGDSRPRSITLEVDNKMPKCDPAVDPTCETGGTISHPTTGKGWKIAAVGGGIVTAGFLTLGIIYKAKLVNLGGSWTDLTNGNTCPPDLTSKPGCVDGPHDATMANVGLIGFGVGAAFTGFAIYKVITQGSSKEHRDAVSRKPAKPEVTFAPIVAPSVAGATLSVDW